MADRGSDAEDDRALTVQVRMFGALALFLVAVSIGYGVWTREYAGATLLLLSGGLTGTCGAYLGWHRPAAGSGHGAAGGGPGVPWFPDASIWPFAVGASIALVANGLLLGLWLLLPASAVLAASLGGFAAQSRRRR